ncbi:MAG: YcnI family protein [Alicyclobacillaceae bacterium]|nr:YcnI family protein [Alicyclobacillaceae bacterium]
MSSLHLGALPLRRIAALVAVFALVFSGMASAHVTVWPQQSQVGAWEKYTVRVPAEKDVPTVKLVLKVPDGMSIESVQPVPGWTYNLQKENGRVTAIEWQAAGNGIGPGEFQEFSFVAKNPQQPGELAWKAYQYYKDNSVVEWTGPKNTDTPASVTVVHTPTGQNEPATHNEPATATVSGRTPSWESWTALGLSVVSLILSLVAVIRKK